MLLSRVPALAGLLFAAATTATITPSNSSTAVQGQAPLPLKHADGDQARIADVVPLTTGAAQGTLQGNVFITNFSNAANVSVGDIAFISCNPSDYTGFAEPQRVFQTAFESRNIAGVLLYSTASDYCGYVQDNNQPMLQDFPVLSMTNKQASQTLLDAVRDVPAGTKYRVRAEGRGDGDGSNNNSNNSTLPPQNPLGPSPSTAVAMIILYSITGIITALFLVIIVTGAVRAHRHPERYGPRDVLGRPRQSRARGLGRAILDTIPIVKFGEKEPAKPTDVELASTAEARGADGAAEPENQTNHAVNNVNGTQPATKTAETTREATSAMADAHQEGIAPAQPAMAAAAMGKDSSSNDENLGCSICTEDFEMGQDLRVLPCNHKFHPECVDPWLLNVSGTCPLCRVDLRPVTSQDSSTSHDPDSPTASANPEVDPSPRHRGAFRDILSLRHRPNATPQERIYYLRRLREQRRNRSGDVAAEGSHAVRSPADAADARRSKRMSVRLSGVFNGRMRRDRSPTQQGESSRSAGQPPPSRDEAPAPDAEDASTLRQT